MLWRVAICNIYIKYNHTVRWNRPYLFIVILLGHNCLKGPQDDPGRCKNRHKEPGHRQLLYWLCSHSCRRVRRVNESQGINTRFINQTCFCQVVDNNWWVGDSRQVWEDSDMHNISRIKFGFIQDWANLRFLRHKCICFWAWVSLVKTWWWRQYAFEIQSVMGPTCRISIH